VGFARPRRDLNALACSEVSTGRGCALELGRFAVVALLYMGVLGYFFPDPGGGTMLASLALAVFSTFLLNSLYRAFVPSADERAVNRAREGVLPEEGARVAVTGELVPIESTLSSPLGQVPCIAYSYWVGETSSGEHGPTTTRYFRGFANAPCAVRSAIGDVKLRGLGPTHTEEFEERSLRGQEARPRLQQYLAENRFAPDPGHDFKLMVGEVKRVFSELAEPPLATRHDYGDPEFEVEPDFLFSETVIRAGDRVTAIGQFSPYGPELRPRGVHLLTLMHGGLERVHEELAERSTAHWAMALAMFVIAHGFLATAIHGGAFE
jgi:hypothetical protein